MTSRSLGLLYSRRIRLNFAGWAVRKSFPKAMTFGCCVWVIAAVAGLRMLWAYSYAPGVSAAAADSWPKDAAIAHDASNFTLVMFLHPHCPCSEASVEELAKLMARCRDAMAVKMI